MTKKSLFSAAFAALMAAPAMAGGLLTNTNQNATFLRNPARGAVIGIDGVYSNPAGVAFMPQGFHFSLSWQAATQKRQLNASNPLFMMNQNNQSANRSFEGKAKAPVIPSFQAAYVFNDKWSASAQFAIGGGGGKCEFENGLPMFEELIGGLAHTNGMSSYGMSQSLTGEQYFYAVQVGATYRILKNLSVFGGVRGVIARSSYEGAITNISLDGKNATQYSELSQQASAAAQQYATAAEAGVPGAAEAAAQYQAAAVKAATAAAMIGDYRLDCRQKDFGITPIIGIDYNLGRLNLAAKYEFRTKINLKNESNNSANLAALATSAPAVAVYADGAKVRSDIPGILTVGAQYSFKKPVRVMGGFHYYWDKDCKGTAIKDGKNTWEINLGAEWDINDKWLVSVGAQRTQYGFADSDMTDTNYNISSTSVHIGGAYKFNDRMKLNVGYMHSFYGNHEFTNANNTACDYTRKNDAVGISFDMSL